MKNGLRSIGIYFILIGLFDGCATILAGYEDNVALTRLPKNVRIYDRDNIEIQIHEKTKTSKFSKNGDAIIDSLVVTGKYISLRSNVDHLLHFKSQEVDKKIHLYPKLSAGWFVLDIVTGTFLIDLYTGNWNHFDDIDYRSTQ